jgi:cellulose biosynthesis protein BcsE
MSELKTIVKDGGRLQIDQLEAGVSLLPGNIYLVCEEDDALAAMLIWGTLYDLCASGGSACLISSANLTKSIGESTHAQGIRRMTANKSLVLLEIQDIHARLRNKMRVALVLQELRHWGGAAKRLLIINGAEKMFANFDAAMLREWRHWAESKSHVVLFIVRQSPTEKTGVITSLLPISHLFSGVARLKSVYGAAKWEVFHWFDHDGVIAGKTYPICKSEIGRLALLPAESAVEAALPPAADEQQVWTMRCAFLANEIVNTSWQMVEKISDVAAIIGNAVAATIVIGFTPESEFTMIARAVFDLRKRYGPRLKIVLREVNSRLRYSQEALMVRLGANMIVCAEVSYSRFLNQIVMVQGQIFPFNLPASYEQAVAETLLEQEQGYLPPAEFCRAVANTLEHSRIVNVENVLLRLPLAYGLLPSDALRYCNIKRPGDFCSADNGHVYLFLYACRESDVDGALDRLFGLPVSELFNKEELFLSLYGIQEAIDDFEARHRREAFPDLSAALTSTSNRQQAKTNVVKAVTKPSKSTKPEGGAHAPPDPAMRHPLPLQLKPVLVDVSAANSPAKL